ncbi:MAG TPA: hypothetical protein VLM39_01650 [Ignavibacteriaceae bacterium]|nr:hypothetical protein [Ignavibacteriaceae bacterium]
MNKRKNHLLVIMVLVFSITAINFLSCKDAPEKVSESIKKTETSLLIGDWVRTDGGYLIKIIKINEDRTLEAEYFNPNPINVGKAQWQESYGNLKIVIELRDVNYPGSTYTLDYLPDRDIFAGEYYQAVEGLTFYVEFSRQ